jgi:hypothetical protein
MRWIRSRCSSVCTCRVTCGPTTCIRSAIRSFVEDNQALVEIGKRVVAPGTQEALDARNTELRAASMTGDEGREANSSLVLPEYRLPSAAEG